MSLNNKYPVSHEIRAIRNQIYETQHRQRWYAMKNKAAKELIETLRVQLSDKVNEIRSNCSRSCN